MWTQAIIVAGMASNVMAQCSSLHLVYARATSEPGPSARVWSKGYGAAGYSLFTNVTSLIPDATGYPVNYPATFGSGSPQQGIDDMIKQLTSKSAACPQTKFALGGHSQGGFVTVDAIPKIPANILSKVVAVTMFGSKPCPKQVSGRCISYCAAGDVACGASGGKGAKSGKGRMVQNDLAMQETMRVELAAAAPNCAQYAALATSGGGKGGHMGYNADGTYVKAAACYIAAKLKSSGS